MNKRYILQGDPKEVEKVIRENRIRINRGVISITPVEPEPVSTESDEPSSGDGNNSDENIPKDGNISGENIPDSSEDIVDEKIMDSKDVEVEDLKEVDLDDDKTLVADDTKDVSADDVKEAETSKKTSKRSKKTE